MTSIPRTSGIYQILCVPTGKIYIGSALDLGRRQQKHWSSLRGDRHENSYLQHAWNKYGELAFEFTVLELVLEPFRLEIEQRWLDKLRAYDRDRGFNVSRVAGAPMSGRKHTPESLAKMSQAQQGRKHSEATRNMMSARNKGKVFGVHTPESSRKKSEAGRGRLHSDETKEKMRQSRLANNSAVRAWIVTPPDASEQRIVNLSQFCAAHDLSEDRMRQVARGGGQHKGWRCRHAD